MFTYRRDFYVCGFPLCDYSRRNKAASRGTTHRVYLWSLALDRMLRRWSPLIKDVLSASFVFMRGQSQRTRYVCHLWNQSNSSGSLQGEMNRIDQNSIWRELEFPQLLRADILNTRASLILSAWLRGKLGSDFLLCLSFLDGLYSYHLKSRFAFHFHVSIQSLSLCLSPGLSLQIKMFRGVSFNVKSSENITALIGIFDSLGQMRLNIDSSGN